MSKWDDERAQTMLSAPEAPSAGGAWSVSIPPPDSNDPTLIRDFNKSGLGAKATLSPGTCPDENLLVELAEGKLVGSARRAIDVHLDTCAACSRLVIELAKLAGPSHPHNAPKRYKVIKQLGAGAMGVVWEAEDTHLHRRVALKFVKPEGIDDKALRKRLLREARALAQVRHPNVVAVYDAGESEDEVCLVLELVTGTNARTWRSAKPRTLPEVLAVWRQAAAGIAAVHRAGIVHRDIKPDNVFVADDNRVMVGDFGLARGDVMDTTTSLTVSGAVIGTPLYMSPEQLHGDTATKKSDQFALCASIWEAVLDERPFRGTTIAAIVLAMLKVPEPPKTATPEQRKILTILQRGLDPDPSKRFDDIDGLIAALSQPGAKSRAPLWIGLGAVVLAVAGTVAVLAVTRRSESQAPAATPGSSAPVGSAAPGSPGSASSGSAAGSATPATAGSASSGSAAGSATPATAGSATPTTAGSATPAAAGSATTAAGSAAPTTAISPPPPRSAQGAPLIATPRDAKGQPKTEPKIAPTRPESIAVPSPSTVEPAGGYTQTMVRASDRLSFGDGAGCLKLLASVPDLPDDEMRRVDLMKASCRMATGDCAGAAAAIDVIGRRLGWETGQIKTSIESTDKAYCPIDAPPQSRWPERAAYRLQIAAVTGRNCKPVQDVIAKHKIELPDPKQAGYFAVQCLANVGDCTNAKQRYFAWLIPKETDAEKRPTLEANHAKGFHTTFAKQCPP
ncbi:MAG: serine/threonine protein kinase [Deltaproteobacteria bacterium]|nr:serine/threonine protein kinase [Deltaproteobacteria bacterium]